MQNLLVEELNRRIEIYILWKDLLVYTPAINDFFVWSLTTGPTMSLNKPLVVVVASITNNPRSICKHASIYKEEKNWMKKTSGKTTIWGNMI